MKCPYCGRDVIYSDRFCKCGAELDMVVCPNCGTPNITLATFCGNCGHFLAGAEPYVPEPDEVEEEGAEEAAAIPEQETGEPAAPEQEPEPEEPVAAEQEAESEENIIPEQEPDEFATPEQEPDEFATPEQEPEPEEPVTQEPEPQPEPEEPVEPEQVPEPEEPVEPEQVPEPEEPVEPEQVSGPEEEFVPEQESEGFITPEPEPETQPEENIVPEQEPEPEETIVPEQESEADGISDQVSEEEAVSEPEPEAAAMEEEGGGKRRRGGLIALWIVIAIIVVILIVFLVWFNRGNRDQNTQDENTENMSDADENLATEEAEEKEEEVPASVSDVAFERKNTDDNYEYAELTATDEAGNVVWEYTTPMYPAAELDRVSPIGLHGSSYFLVQDGAVVALDKSNGDVLWENGDYGGTPVDHSWDYASDGLYLCGYNGPAIYAVSYDGQTLGKIDAFDNLTEETETNLWPYKVYVSGREATVLYGPENVLQESDMAITEDEATVYSVNLDTWEYNLVSNGAPKAEDNSDNNDNGDNGDTGNDENGSDNNGGTESGDNGSDNNGGSGEQSAAPEVNMSDVSNVTASSYLYEANVNISHDPKYLVDGTLENAWCENASGDGSGEWAKIDFNGTYTVSGMNINAGYQKSEALYFQNGRPREITLNFSDGSYVDATLEDVNNVQTVTFPDPVSTSSVTITIRSVYNGSKYEDMCISEVAFY